MFNCEFGEEIHPKIRTFHKVFACEPSFKLAKQLKERVDRIESVLQINVDQFPDGNQQITVPDPNCDGQNLVYVASYWHNDQAKLIDLRVIQFLSERGARHLTVVIPFFGSATNERAETGCGKVIGSDRKVDYETVAIAATDAKMLSCFGNGNTRVRILLYDLHTLANRFYFGSSVNIVMDSTLPFALGVLSDQFQVIVCPDDGARKRFSTYFDRPSTFFYKERCGNERVLKAADPELLQGKKVLIVDDLIRTGNTIGECAVQCKKYGATSVIVFVPHAVFPKGEYSKFVAGPDDLFSQAVDHFYTTSSLQVTENLDRSKFTVLSFAAIVAESNYF